MSKAKRGWKLGRRDTAPTHDQRLVSHTPVAPTSGSSPYFSNLGPATGRRAQHHPLRQNATKGVRLTASFRTLGLQNSVPTPMLSKLRTPSPCHHGHPLVCLLQK
eukprot:jgi/Botrbrau1/10561/Bobra.0343s0009.1